MTLGHLSLPIEIVTVWLLTEALKYHTMTQSLALVRFSNFRARGKLTFGIQITWRIWSVSMCTCHANKCTCVCLQTSKHWFLLKHIIISSQGHGGRKVDTFGYSKSRAACEWKKKSQIPLGPNPGRLTWCCNLWFSLGYQRDSDAMEQTDEYSTIHSYRFIHSLSHAVIRRMLSKQWHRKRGRLLCLLLPKLENHHGFGRYTVRP